MKTHRLLTHWFGRYFAITMLGLAAWPASVQASDPNIVSEPQDVSVPAGVTAQFFFTVSGTMPLTNSWYRITNGTTLFVSTKIGSNSLGTAKFTNSLVAQGPQSFFAICSSSAGSVTSRVAALTIQSAAPTITGQPQDIQTNSGANVTIKVTATGSAPLSYQWYYNGDVLGGSTKSSISWTNVSTNVSGGYQAIVSNSSGSATSRVATVTIGPPAPPGAPYITKQPTNAVVSTNGASTVSFSVTANGAATLTYQWYFNGGALGSGTDSSLSVFNPAGDISHAGSYYAIVANGLGSVTSKVATLTFQSLTPAHVSLLNHFATSDVLLLSSLQTNKNYTIQISSNFLNWDELYSFVASSTSRRYTNYLSGGGGGLYYRLSSP